MTAGPGATSRSDNLTFQQGAQRFAVADAADGRELGSGDGLLASDDSGGFNGGFGKRDWRRQVFD
jgi:hypothetical protein